MTTKTHNLTQVGLQRSGTTIVSRLLADNFTHYSLHTGHKHTANKLPNQTTLILVTKNPYAWLVSVLKWLRVDPHKHGQPRHIYSFLLEAYHHRNRDWLEHATHHVRHEDIVTNPEAWLDEVRDDWGLTPSHDGRWIVEPKLASPLPDSQNRNTRFDASYYTEARYLDELPGLEYVKSVMDNPNFVPVQELLGYSSTPPGCEEYS